MYVLHQPHTWSSLTKLVTWETLVPSSSPTHPLSITALGSDRLGNLMRPLRWPFLLTFNSFGYTIAYYEFKTVTMSDVELKAAATRIAAYLAAMQEYCVKQDQIHGFNGNTPLLASDLRTVIDSLVYPSPNEVANRREFVAYWRKKYQYSEKHAFLDELGNFITPEDDPIHMGYQVWCDARK